MDLLRTSLHVKSHGIPRRRGWTCQSIGTWFHSRTDAQWEKYRRFLERLSLTRAIWIHAKPSYARNMLDEQSRKWVDRAKDLWCKSFHHKPMWPINGRYQCGSCFRYHAVCWEQVAGQHGAGREYTRQTGRRSFNSAL